MAENSREQRSRRCPRSIRACFLAFPFLLLVVILAQFGAIDHFNGAARNFQKASWHPVNLYRRLHLISLMKGETSSQYLELLDGRLLPGSDDVSERQPHLAILRSREQMCVWQVGSKNVALGRNQFVYCYSSTHVNLLNRPCLDTCPVHTSRPHTRKHSQADLNHTHEVIFSDGIPTLLPVVQYGESFQHALQDGLPILASMVNAMGGPQAIRQTGARIVLRKDKSGWMHFFANQFGFSDAKIVDVRSEDTTICLDHAILAASLPQCSFAKYPSSAWEQSSHALHLTVSNSFDNNLRREKGIIAVFLRGNDILNGRSVVNEQAMADAVKVWADEHAPGLEFWLAKDLHLLSKSHTVSQMGRIRLAIGLHGGALCNLALSRHGDGVTLVELTVGGKAARSFKSMAVGKGFKYHPLPISCPNDADTCNPDLPEITVPVDKLIDHLNSVIVNLED